MNKTLAKLSLLLICQDIACNVLSREVAKMVAGLLVILPKFLSLHIACYNLDLVITVTCHISHVQHCCIM